MNKEKIHQNQTQCHNELITHFKVLDKHILISRWIMGSTLVLYFTLIAIMFWG